MPRRLALMLVICAFALAIAGFAIAKAEQPVVVVLGNLRITANGTISPTKLPKNEFAPIVLHLSGKVETLNKQHPPALKRLIIETDKSGVINAKGLPVCSAGKLQAQDTAHAESICKSALVGEGKASVEVEFPGQRPFLAKSKVLAFNGGVKGRTTTILIHAYLTAPISAAVVIAVKALKIHDGRFGLRSTATVPKIASGYGSPVSFSLKLGRTFSYKGKKQSYLLAKCPEGNLVAIGTAVFYDGDFLSGGLVRTC